MGFTGAFRQSRDGVCIALKFEWPRGYSQKGSHCTCWNGTSGFRAAIAAYFLFPSPQRLFHCLALWSIKKSPSITMCPRRAGWWFTKICFVGGLLSHHLIPSTTSFLWAACSGSWQGLLDEHPDFLGLLLPSLMLLQLISPPHHWTSQMYPTHHAGKSNPTLYNTPTDCNNYWWAGFIQISFTK